MGKQYFKIWFVDKEMKDDRKLLDLIKRYPELYDKDHDNFLNAAIRNEIWIIIAKELKCKEQKLEKRFEELITKFNKEKQLFNNNIPMHGQWPLLGIMQEYFDNYNLDFYKANPDLEEHTFREHVEKFIKKMHDIKIS